MKHQGSLLVPVLVATTGNSLGAFTTYWLGWRAASAAQERGVAPERARRAADALRRHGHPLLFLSWVPVLGDALVAAAGASGMAVVPMVLWVVAGKAARYLVLGWSVQQVTA